MNIIRRHSFVLVSTVFLLSVAFAETVVEDQTNERINNGRSIFWSTNDERDVQVFEIWRSGGSEAENAFSCIARINPSGNNSDYRYCDTSLTMEKGESCTYRIVAHGKSSDLVERTIRARTLSSVFKQPWTSIETVFQ